MADNNQENGSHDLQENQVDNIEGAFMKEEFDDVNESVTASHESYQEGFNPMQNSVQPPQPHVQTNQFVQGPPQASKGHFVVDKRDIPKRSFSQSVNRGIILLILCAAIVLGLCTAELVKNNSHKNKIEALYNELEPFVMEAIFPNDEYAEALRLIQEVNPENEKQNPQMYYGEQSGTDSSALIQTNPFLMKKRDEMNAKLGNLFVSELSKNTVANRVVTAGYNMKFSFKENYVADHSDGMDIKSHFAHNDGLAQLNIAKKFNYSQVSLSGNKSSSHEFDVLVMILAYEVDGEWKIKDFNMAYYDRNIDQSIARGYY